MTEKKRKLNVTLLFTGNVIWSSVWFEHDHYACGRNISDKFELFSKILKRCNVSDSYMEACKDLCRGLISLIHFFK